MTADTVFACAVLVLGAIALRDEFRSGGSLRSEPKPTLPKVCDDCRAPDGYHYLGCDRVQFVIEMNVAAFSRELAEWDGSLDEIRSAS